MNVVLQGLCYSSKMWYDLAREMWPRERVESFCRQVLSLCDREYMQEYERLHVEQRAILDARKREREYEAGIDEAPGEFVSGLSS